ncbi:zinc finger, CCHC-type containing protein [Tanacetum coccineum]|uniref:Zinc finger, CCHC-type containing protein n=1 Tax=Tanacetum coccineum TaxID=301880 RepID=A0ABQ5FFB8_9ASTR
MKISNTGCLCDENHDKHLDCVRVDVQLRIVLSAEDKLNYLELPIPATPVPAIAGQQVPPETLAAHVAWVKGQKEIIVLMLMTMEPDLQHNLETLGAYDMLKELKTLFAQQVEQELLQTVREFHASKQEEGQSISSYVLKMKGYIDNFERLGHPVSLSLAQERSKKNKKPQLAAKGNYKGKVKSKLAYAPKPKNPPPTKKEDPAKDSVCHHCGDIDHWKRNCPQYLSELLKNKKLSQGASNSGIFTIELFTFPGKSWVYDTGYGTHICNTTQGFRRSRKLKPGALSLYMGNGQRADVEAIGSYDLCFPSGLVLVLHNCHYAPSITRGVISVSRLYNNGFINRFENDNSISISKDNLIYFNVLPRYGIFEIVLSDSNTNVSSMYVVSNKRAKLNLDSSLLWHCHLGHISKKHIEKLQHDGLLNSIDSKSFEKCVLCLSGKKARKPYSHQWGEYMSQEFMDHLKEHGIIAHRTPPYMPQHNGMFERRNRTLLDMVCSMMSQITLRKSFWDYALESAERILNIVPTKKVEKTPYELWYGYPKETMGYYFYYPLENKVFVARNVEFFENSLIIQEASGSLEDLEIIQEEDTHPSENTSSHHDEDNQEINEPQSDIIPIRRSTRTRHALDRMCLNIEADEYELGDLNEPANYKAALSDPEFDKWLNAMNVEIYDMENSKHGSIPMQEKLKLIKSQGASTPAEVKPMQNVPYASAVGSIMYAVRCTRPDVVFAQNITSRFQQMLNELHWTAVKNILKYLRNTKANTS